MRLRNGRFQSLPVPILAIASLLFWGCGGAPSRVVPEWDITVPAGWAAVDSGEISTPIAPIDEAWWKTFGSASLDSVVTEALSGSPTLQAMAAGVDAARAGVTIAGSSLWPQINLGMSASRARGNLSGSGVTSLFSGPDGAPEVIEFHTNRFDLSLSSSWEVDLWGRNQAGRSASVADAQAALADLAAGRLSYAALTAKAWFALTEARLQADLAERTEQSYRKAAERLARRYQQGVRPSLDYRLALAALARSESALEASRQQADFFARNLEILLGRYPAGDQTGGLDLPALNEELPAGLPADLVLRRPDLVATERRLAGAGRRVSEAKRSLLPGIKLTASGGRLSDQIEDLLEGDFSVWSIAGSILQPIFQGGRLKANVDRTAALERQALGIYANALLTAFGEVEGTLVAHKTLQGRERALRTAWEQSEAARRLAERQYDSGLINIITLLEAQRSAFGTEAVLLAVRRARLDSRVDLYVALGGGFDIDKDWFSYLEEVNEP